MKKSVAAMVMIFFSMVLMISCSDGTGNTVLDGSADAQVVESVSDLPACGSENDGSLYYITDEPSHFEYCGSGSYHAIDLERKVNWLGQLNAAPVSPEVRDAYYDTVLGESRIWDGSEWDTMARSSAIRWLGSLASAPGAVAVNDAYYNTLEGRSYIYTASGWSLMASDGTNGTNGVSIRWLGSLDDYPLTRPLLNNAFYHTGENAAFIWDGRNWEILCRDGQSYSSMNVSDSVANGSYLSLVHNINRNNLTFTGQFLKDTYIYDYTDYEYIAGKGITVKNVFSNFTAAPPSILSTTCLSGGNILIAYRDEANNNTGTFQIFNSTGSRVAGPTVFDGENTYFLSTAALPGGGFIIVYNNSTSAEYHGTFRLFDFGNTFVRR